MKLQDALVITMPYIKHLAHDSRLYDREDIIQEGRIATWLAAKSVDDDMTYGEMATFLKRNVSWRINNFINSNLVHCKIGRTTLVAQKQRGIDVISLYRHLPCANFDNFKSKWKWCPPSFKQLMKIRKKQGSIVQWLGQSADNR